MKENDMRNVDEEVVLIEKEKVKTNLKKKQLIITHVIIS